MTQQNQSTSSQLSTEEAQEIMRSLLHKEGNWIDWGKKCKILQQSGYEAAEIFEATGFQKSQQNMVIVASQVYESLVQENAPDSLLTYYQGPRSDVLYELRVLNHKQRLECSQLACEKRLDIDEAHKVVKSMQEISRLVQLPAEFTRHPGDAVAYISWKRCKNSKDLQQRTRLIAQGLKYAHSQSAREAIERLLSDFSIQIKVNAPLLPIYRFESEEDLPHIIPVAGTFPLDKATFEKINGLEAKEPFRVVEIESNSTIVPVPGWQSILKAVDPVGIFIQSDQLPTSISGKSEEVLLIVDRSMKEWDISQYLLVEEEGKLQVKWFENEPDYLILAQVILVLRPKKILDENHLLQPWQFE